MKKMPAPSGPSSHLWPSAARKSIGVWRTSKRKDAQPLDGIEKQQRPPPVDQLGQPVQIVPPSAGVGHPTDADDPGPVVAGGGEPVEVEPSPVGGDAAGFHPAVGQMKPRVLVRGELVGPGDDVVARPSRETPRPPG